MKKVYIPTNEELICMKNDGLNIYTYLLNKTIESLIMEDILYEEEDMFEVSYNQFSEYPEIVYAIAKLYPERIKENDRAMNDTKLCMKLINSLQSKDKSIYGLDNMTQFSEDVLKDKNVIIETIKMLSTSIPKNPRYRFEYLGPNQVLDDIFAGEVNPDIISNDIVDSITSIEPAYYIKLKDRKDIINLHEKIKKSILRYSFRYGVNGQEYELTDERTKKLIRQLEIHKKNHHF